MWKAILVAVPICLLVAVTVYSPKIAGGMVYRTNEGIDPAPGGIMEYLAGHGDAAAAGILEKEKAYYAASIDKTKARLGLARARVNEANLADAERKMALGRLSSGEEWLDNTKKTIMAAGDRASFDAAVSYKEWHAVKMLPAAAEGYAIACAMRRADIPEEAKALAGRAGATFAGLLSLDRGSDFDAAEKARQEAFGELQRANEIINNTRGHR